MNFFGLRTLTLATVVMNLASFGAPAWAQTTPGVQATKSAPSLSWDNIYMKADIRHYTLVKAKENGDVVGSPSRAEIRPILGTKLIDGRLDSFLTLGIVKQNETDRLDERRPEFESRFVVVRTVAGKTEPYTRLNLPFAGKGTDVDVGLRQGRTFPFEVTGGTLGMVYEIKPWAQFASRASDATVKNSSGHPASEYGLVGKESGSRLKEPKAQKSPAFQVRNYFGTSFAPAAVAGAAIQIGLAHNQKQKPKYELTEDGHLKETYAVTTTMEHEVLLSYAVDKTLVISNEWNAYNAGYWRHPVTAKDRAGEPRIENIVKIEYLLY